MKKNTRLLFNVCNLFGVLGIWLLKFAPPVAAVICNPALKNGCTPSTNPQGYFNNVLSVVFSAFFIVGTLYFVWHMVLAGYHLIASEGDPKRWETAKNELTWGFVGIAIVFSVFALLKVVGIVLGIQGLENLTIEWPTL